MGAVSTHRRRKAEEKMNVWYIALWVYLLGGEAVLLAIAFNICRKEVKKAPQSGGRRTHKA